MRVSILGAGNVGCAMAADLSTRGHRVTLIKTSDIPSDNFDFLRRQSGVIRMIENGQETTSTIARVSHDIADATGSDVIAVAVQTNYHEQLIERLIPVLDGNSIVLFVPGYLSTAYMIKHGMPEGTICAEAESSFIDCRVAEPGLIKVGFRNVRNPIATYPQSARDQADSILNQLGFPFTRLDSVVAAALHNPNMIVHTVGAVMSIPRIEATKGDYCMYHEVFTPSVWNILEALDGEKMDVLAKLGLPRVAYVDACKFRNSLDDTRDAKDVFFWYASMPTRAKGPMTVDSRYIAEDVPQGLVLLEALGQATKTATPIATSLINMAGAALGRNLRAEGRTPDRLSLAAIDLILRDQGFQSTLESLR
jgi:opine dehydrogenase